MVKEIKIGAVGVTFKSSAALPVLYRELTGREFFVDMQKITDNFGVAADMAYTMYRHANPEDTTSKAEWLERFEFMDLNNSLMELVDMLTYETKTKSAAKKNNQQ